MSDSIINRAVTGVRGIRRCVWILLSLFKIFNILLGRSGRMAGRCKSEV